MWSARRRSVERTADGTSERDRIGNAVLHEGRQRLFGIQNLQLSARAQPADVARQRLQFAGYFFAVQPCSNDDRRLTRDDAIADEIGNDSIQRLLVLIEPNRVKITAGYGGALLHSPLLLSANEALPAPGVARAPGAAVMACGFRGVARMRSTAIAS